MIKYVELFNFLPGERAAYEAWAEEIDTRLVGAPELRGIRVYENVFFTTPQRVVELEFDDLAGLERYFDRPDIRAVYLEWGERCTSQQSLVLRATDTYGAP